MSLIVFLGDKVIASVSFDSTASSLTGSLDTEDDETVLTRELVLTQKSNGLVAGRRGDQRGGHSERFGIARRPRVAIGIQLAFAVRSGSVPDHLLGPDDIVENIPVVETVDVVLSGGNELAGPPAAVHLVPRAE